ncbi:MAG: hypothetical protein JWN65_574 [Solirubrobacterales bacterium]|nr:hypothetical protein [Solirubrobacterales bacterium]
MHNGVRAVFVACCLALLAGCGGDKAGDSAEKAPITAPKAIEEKASLLGDGAASAGNDESYEPTGAIVADSGFRPDVDGFSFENYGNDVEPQNMTPFEVEDIFGNQVCVRGTGEECQLSPLAAKWMEAQNASMAGGHCMGFSVTALRMFNKTVDPKDYGADRPIDIEIQGNVNLQALIAENFVFQAFPTVLEQTVEGSPNEVLKQLEADLDSGDEAHTIGIYQADGGGGHAITPFAVEDRGDGLKKILVYDNNFPGIIRAIDVDTNKNTWRYVGGTNPKDLEQVYEGDADTQSLSLLPTSPGEVYQPCPFCSGESSTEGNAKDYGTVLGKAKQYNEIRLTTVKKHHPHLILEDAEGRRTGIVDGQLIREIPDVRVARNLTVQNWNETAEPVFQAPVGLPLTVHVDGSQLPKAVNSGITITGPGLDVEVDSIRLAPGQQDTVSFPGDGAGLVYETDGKAKSSPDLYATVEDGDVTKDGAYYVVGTAALGFSAGSRVGFELDQEAGTFTLDTTGTKPSAASDGLGGKSLYVATLVRETAKGQSSWLTEDPILLKGGDNGERLKIDYRGAPAKTKPLKVIGGRRDGPKTTYIASPDR